LAGAFAGADFATIFGAAAFAAAGLLAGAAFAATGFAATFSGAGFTAALLAGLLATALLAGALLAGALLAAVFVLDVDSCFAGVLAIVPPRARLALCRFVPAGDRPCGHPCACRVAGSSIYFDSEDGCKIAQAQLPLRHPVY
jgi:hypothetical protein